MLRNLGGNQLTYRPIYEPPKKGRPSALVVATASDPLEGLDTNTGFVRRLVQMRVLGKNKTKGQGDPDILTKLTRDPQQLQLGFWAMRKWGNLNNLIGELPTGLDKDTALGLLEADKWARFVAALEKASDPGLMLTFPQMHRAISPKRTSAASTKMNNDLQRALEDDDRGIAVEGERPRYISGYCIGNEYIEVMQAMGIAIQQDLTQPQAQTELTQEEVSEKTHNPDAASDVWVKDRECDSGDACVSAVVQGSYVNAKGSGKALCSNCRDRL